MELAARSVLVLGATGGIGMATARLLIAQGALVLGVARPSDRLAAAAAELGPAFRPIACDARDADALLAAVESAGAIHDLVLAMNGGAATGPFREVPIARLRDAFENKFWPYVTGLRAALPALAPDGSVTLVTGVSASKPAPGIAGLAATNGALEAMVGTLALELAPIRVNAVSPGVTDTSHWDGVPQAMRATFFARAAEAMPVRRVGTADEIAAAILSVITDRFITGIVLPVDGGMKVS